VSLLAIAVYQATSLALNHRYREHAHSYNANNKNMKDSR